MSKESIYIESGSYADVLAALRTGKPVKIAVHAYYYGNHYWHEAVEVTHNEDQDIRFTMLAPNEGVNETAWVWRFHWNEDGLDRLECNSNYVTLY